MAFLQPFLLLELALFFIINPPQYSLSATQKALILPLKTQTLPHGGSLPKPSNKLSFRHNVTLTVSLTVGSPPQSVTMVLDTQGVSSLGSTARKIQTSTPYSTHFSLLPTLQSHAPHPYAQPGPRPYPYPLPVTRISSATRLSPTLTPPPLKATSRSKLSISETRPETVRYLGAWIPGSVPILRRTPRPPG